MNRFQKKLEKISSDVKVTAKAIGLRYIEDRKGGYYRVKEGETFSYYDADGKKVRDKELLERFKKLVIPPAYQDVWISPAENTHLQFTGFDQKGRKQYRYHPEWNRIRNHAKFYRLRRFAEVVPLIRKRTEEDLSKKGLSFERVLGLIVRLMELTIIGIGSESDSKL